jgi:hypothetical protein
VVFEGEREGGLDGVIWLQGEGAKDFGLKVRLHKKDSAKRLPSL